MDAQEGTATLDVIFPRCFSLGRGGGLVSVWCDNLDLDQIRDDITTSEMTSQRK